MIKILKYIMPVTLIVFVTMAFTKTTSVETTKIKCMIQMVNYTGEGAYVVISLLNADNQYEETLYVQGKDKEWYSDITEWWKFYGKRRPNIDAISGETIAGGERTVSVISIPSDKIDNGYSIRFETAVEDKEYYPEDIQFELTSESVKSKVAGKGFIRYVRMMPQ